jgi:mono/diheme cytochrome c family protein
VEHGRDLAKRWCASCHVVSPDQQSASADVPPFATIAQSLNFDPKRLAYFLLEPHPKMPQMALSRSAADDIAAYIQSLKRVRLARPEWRSMSPKRSRSFDH